MISFDPDFVATLTSGATLGGNLRKSVSLGDGHSGPAMIASGARGIGLLRANSTTSSARNTTFWGLRRATPAPLVIFVRTHT
jgi:hypothetical protein